jgi:hypothetical protein
MSKKKLIDDELEILCELEAPTFLYRRVNEFNFRVS